MFLSDCVSDLQAAPVSFSLQVPHAWVQTFQIPWESISPSLSFAMSRGERAGATDRRAMVRAVVDAMRQRCANPSRAACVEVAKMIVSNYPLTFADRTEEGEQLGTGYFSLLNQLKSRVDNLNRGGSVPLKRRQPRAPRSSKKASTYPRTLRKCKKHSYGCVNWQPALPQNKSSSSLENKRKEMVEIFTARGAGAAETPRVAELMALTYALQRRMINSSPVLNVAAVRAQFPFLFTKSCLNEHFRTLTGVDLLPRLREALLNKGARIRTFFWSQNRDQHQTRDQTRDLWRLLEWTDTDQRQTGLSALLLVMKHFLEREEAIFVHLSSNKTMIQNIKQNLQWSGDSVLASRRWMVSLDRAVVFESESSFADALAVFFCCFYVFNLEYEEPACATLELIQRYFARINPAEGTKCTAKTGVSRKTGETVTRKTETINCRVASFLRRLSEPGLSQGNEDTKRCLTTL
uniref:Uncharacterized protein n=1 Tax=Neogobius melanostomus TaxID=47308 RepID=A0A8C6V2R4_9GOBI